MAVVHFVDCPSCGKEYYLETNLFHTVRANPGKHKLKCPFCKSEFNLQGGKGDASVETGASSGCQ